MAPSFIAGMMPYRGEVLTTLSLRSLLGRKERRSTGSVLVLDDGGTNERLGLMVDAVCGVVTVQRTEAMRANPSTLDARSQALFDGSL